MPDPDAPNGLYAWTVHYSYVVWDQVTWSTLVNLRFELPIQGSQLERDIVQAIEQVLIDAHEEQVLNYPTERQSYLRANYQTGWTDTIRDHSPEFPDEGD